MSEKIKQVKEKFLLENPNIAFGSIITQNATEFPYRFPFNSKKDYLLIDARDETPVVYDVIFLAFEIEDNYAEEDEYTDLNNLIYDGYTVYYEFQFENKHLLFSELIMSETEEMGYILVYEKQTT